MKYAIRVRRHGGPWKRVRKITNPKGLWKSRAKAHFVLDRLKRKGYVGHVFEVDEKVQYPTKTHYSEHFTRAELQCKCGCEPSAAVEANLTELAKDLELMRLELGAMSIVSGHRCRARNDAVGGARDSRHIYGEAADLAVPNGKQAEYVKAAEKVPAFRNGGIGVYPHGGVHVDHRPWIARWNSWSR